MTVRAPAPMYRSVVPAADVRRGDGAELVEFAESELVQVNLSVAGAPGDPLRMRPWQRRIHAELLARRPNGRLRHRTALIGMPRKNGKALDVETPILTPSGWTTMGELQVGDQVLGPDGRPTRVLAVTEPMVGHECLEVEFAHGQTVVADADHLWTVRDRLSPAAPRTLTTARISSGYRLVPSGHRYSVPAPPTARRREPNWVVGVTPVPTRPVRCIRVDRADGLFLAGPGLVPTHNSGGIGVPLALHRLFLGAGGEEIYSCAAEKEQARIVFGDAAETIRASPNLVDLCKIGKDYVEVLGTGSVYQVLSAEAYSKEGRRPALTVYDELHAAPDRGLWDVMANGRGSSPDAQLVAITTPGVRQDRLGQDTICFEQFQYGVRVVTGELADETFYFVWWGAPDSADHRDPRNWRRANPGYGDILDPADLADGARKQPEPDFRTKRLGQWVSGTAGYLPGRAWEVQAQPREITRDEPVVLTLDGSFNNDSTAIVVTTLGSKPYQDVVEAWERPPSAGDDWRVPILDVENTLRDAARQRYRVVSIAADPARWARSLQLLEAEGLPVVEFPQSPERMTKATVQHYDLVVDGDLTHSGEPRLARHIGNAVLKSDARGSRLAKETRNSRRHIDLAVCSVMGTVEAARMTGQVANYDVLDSIL